MIYVSGIVVCLCSLFACFVAAAVGSSLLSIFCLFFAVVVRFCRSNFGSM